MYGAFSRFFSCGACRPFYVLKSVHQKYDLVFSSLLGPILPPKRHPNRHQIGPQKNIYILLSLGIDFLMDFAPKMVPKKDPERLLFLERLFYRFLKDVLNKTSTLEVEKESKSDPSRHPKTFTIDVAQKRSQMSQKACQRGTKKRAKNPQKRSRKRRLKKVPFFPEKDLPFRLRPEKVVVLHRSECNLKKKVVILFERETPPCAPVEVKRPPFLAT